MRIDTTQPSGRADRVALGRPATMRDPARTPVDVLVDNLSETGALLRTDTQLPVGSLVSLGLAGLGMQLARVVRTPARAAAIEFMVPLDPAAVARVTTTKQGFASVAIPQILVERASTSELREAPAAPPAEAGGAPIARLPVTPLPLPPVAASLGPVEIASDGIASDAGPQPAAETPPAPDARALWPLPAGKAPPSLPGFGSWLLAGVVLCAAIIILLL